MKAATIVFLVSASVDLALAAGAYSTKTVLNICRTELGPSAKNPIPTTSKYLTIPLVAKRWVTSTPSAVVTPAPTTQTTTTILTAITTTIAPPVTDTVFVTLFSTNTIVVETTEVSSTLIVNTESVLTTGPTTTVVSSAGFIPARSSIPNSLKKRKASRIEKKEAVINEARAAGDLIRSGPKKFPTKVYCGGVVAVITGRTSTLTAKKTITITAPTPTRTSVVSTTTTSTVTIIPPGASTTNTIISTTQVTSTSTVSTVTTILSTATIVAEVPGPTVYDACSPANIVSTSNNVPISGGNYGPGVSPNFIDATSAYDCCVACIASSNCGSALFYGGQCSLLLINGQTCSQNNIATTLFTRAGDFDPILRRMGSAAEMYSAFDGLPCCSVICVKFWQ